MIKPLSLKPHDAVALIAPADRPREPSEVQRAKTWLERIGLRVKVGAYVLARHGYLAGTDAERLEDFHAAWADDDVRAIFCLRGKWGASRLLTMIDYGLVASHPKIFVGCGDVTALLLAIHQRTGLVTFHGPNLATMKSAETAQALGQALTRNAPIGKIPRERPQFQSPNEGDTNLDFGIWDLGFELPHVIFRGGTATGKLIGGSIAALIGLFGAPFHPNPDGALLFLEETDQRFSQFDRDLTTLRLAQFSTAVNGLVIGECAGANLKDNINSLSLEEIFAEQLAHISAPACYGLPIGQGKVQHTLPIGVQARMDADAGTLEILETATI
jgi:muramoyltetrapeptide carboxypeptidase